MRRVVLAGLAALLGLGCSSREREPGTASLVAADSVCAAQCRALSIEGSLVELTPASQALTAFTRLAKTDSGWVVAWRNYQEKATYLQRLDASGTPADGAFRIQNAQSLAPHWDGSSLALWTQIYDQDVPNAGQPQTLAFARFDGALAPLDSTLLSGPDSVVSSVAYDFGGAPAFAYTTARIAMPVRQLRLLPGPALEQSQHFLEQAAQGAPRSSLAWTGKQIAATYSAADGYRTTFLEPTTLAETSSVDLGRAGGEAPQGIQSAMGDTLLWIAVWEMSSLSLWAIDVASGTVAMDPIHLPWHSTLSWLTTAGDVPLVISEPNRPIEPENAAVVPIDAQSQQACPGTRFGDANVVALDVASGEGAAVLDLSHEHLYFARVRCEP